MARGGFIRTDRQHLKQLLAECEVEWKTLNREVKRINRVSIQTNKHTDIERKVCMCEIKCRRQVNACYI